MKRLLMAAMFAGLLLALPPQGHAMSTDVEVDESPAMVFGSIEGVPGMRHVYIQKLGKVYVGRINRPRTELLGGGAFYFDDVPPGEYYLAGFSRGGELFWFTYTKETVQKALFTVAPGEVRFMGSYRVTEVKKKLLSRGGSFDIERVDSPGEAEILGRIAPEVEGSAWAPIVEARRKEVSVAAAASP